MARLAIFLLAFSLAYAAETTTSPGSNVCKAGVYGRRIPSAWLASVGARSSDLREILPADCGYKAKPAGAFCQPYSSPYKLPQQMDWVPVITSLVCALMAFGIGANDSANSWGTSEA